VRADLDLGRGIGLFGCFVGAALLAYGPGCAGEQPGATVSIVRQLATSEAPEDHTFAFRRNHSQSASSPDAKCSNCHFGLSGSPVDSCAECHSTSRPRDHRARWRGPEHGRSAAADPVRCNTCHEADVCASCHDIPPPSHSPLRIFRGRHGRLASLNTRSCLTCHSFESTCVDCHSLDVPPQR
jgi:hypothetical protein